MNTVNCLICGSPLSIRTAKGRESNKPFIMLICPKDGRHFRAFISDQNYIKKVLEEKGTGTKGTGSDSTADICTKQSTGEGETR
ncbi:hypothetical protein Dform_01449 [Dehalogenimonas formicexedens]|uniref:Uncharacterized protein n=2 Tax=Dehalogenimonas TaxID=670486 RepID=A0A1P8F8H3_9CHLR|nr:hypothetical protein Dform_01449 [Dehalogenimonas formicexedens]KTB48859.1 hypothetical protein DEALK_17060 [Dehalogenimonas alkenigignens]